MKVFLLPFIAISILLISCKEPGLSKKDKEEAEFYIDLHNTNVATKFMMDSINEATNFHISIIHLKGKIDINDHIQTHMKVFRNNWNDPYNIQKDRFLTLEKYLEYCKAHQRDPNSYYKFLD